MIWNLFGRPQMTVVRELANTSVFDVGRLLELGGSMVGIDPSPEDGGDDRKDGNPEGDDDDDEHLCDYM